MGDIIMLLPGPEKQAIKYEEAHKRAKMVYKQYPHLGAIAQEISTILQSKDLVGKHFQQKYGQKLEALQKRYRQYLQANDISPRFTHPQFDCNKCQDSGWLEMIDKEASEQYGYAVKSYTKCRCLINAEKQYRIEKLFDRARMTAELRNQTFDKFRLDVYDGKRTKHGQTYRDIMAANKQWAQEFVASVREGHARKKEGLSLGQRIPSLFLHGPTGVGKTFLCSAMANSLLELGVPVLYLPFADLLGMIRSSFSERNENETEQLMAEVRNIDVLILDDLGAENITGFVGETLFTILNHRLASEFKPMVISSNLDLNQIGDTYNKRISSRIERHALVLECMGNDLRERFAAYKHFKGFPRWE